MATTEFSGPVDYAVLVAPRTARLGAGLRLLLDRVDAGTIELLDLEVIGRDTDGDGVRLPFSVLGSDDFADVSVFDGAESDILDDDDVSEIAGQLGDDEFAVAIVYEDRSLAAVAQAWAAEGGTLLWSGGIAVSDLESTLENTTEES